MAIWYPQEGTLDVQLAVKEGGPSSEWLAPQGAPMTFQLDSQDPPTSVIAVPTAIWPFNQNRQVAFNFSKLKRESELRFAIRFRNAGNKPVVVDSWIEKGRGLTFANPTVECTLTMPGTARGAITVANHTSPGSTCDSGSAIHETSGRGPVRGAPVDPEYAKPTLAAPGVDITSARANADCPCPCPDWLECQYTSKDGTSTSAPHVAGAVALMLQKNPTLTGVQVRDILKANATPVNGDVYAWGAGKLDAKRAWDAVTAPAPPPAPPNPPGVIDANTQASLDAVSYSAHR